MEWNGIFHNLCTITLDYMNLKSWKELKKRIRKSVVTAAKISPNDQTINQLTISYHQTLQHTNWSPCEKLRHLSSRFLPSSFRHWWHFQLRRNYQLEFPRRDFYEDSIADNKQPTKQRCQITETRQSKWRRFSQRYSSVETNTKHVRQSRIDDDDVGNDWRHVGVFHYGFGVDHIRWRFHVDREMEAWVQIQGPGQRCGDRVRMDGVGWRFLELRWTSGVCGWSPPRWFVLRRFARRQTVALVRIGIVWSISSNLKK